MDYWAETMQDDCYLIADDGWKARRAASRSVKVKNKEGKLVWPETHDFKKGKRRFKSDLIPAALLIARYFAAEQAAIEALEAELAALEQQIEESGGTRRRGRAAGRSHRRRRRQAEDHRQSVEGAAQGNRQATRSSPTNARRSKTTLALLDKQADAQGRLKAAQEDLDAKLDAKYPKLTEDEIKTLVVDDKWLATLAAAVQGELDRVSQTLTGRIRQLAERYATPLPQLTDEVAALAARVDGHLKKMGAVWK